MLVIKIELHSAVTGQATELGHMTITNMGSVTHATKGKRGDYYVQVLRRGSKKRRVQRAGVVRSHPRMSKSVWNLVRKALEAVKF